MVVLDGNYKLKGFILDWCQQVIVNFIFFGMKGLLVVYDDYVDQK